MLYAIDSKIQRFGSQFFYISFRVLLGCSQVKWDHALIGNQPIKSSINLDQSGSTWINVESKQNLPAPPPPSQWPKSAQVAAVTLSEPSPATKHLRVKEKFKRRNVFSKLENSFQTSTGKQEKIKRAKNNCEKIHTAVARLSKEFYSDPIQLILYSIQQK